MDDGAMMNIRKFPLILAGAMLATPASAQDSRSDTALRTELEAAIQMLERQQEQLDRQTAELADLRRRIEGGINVENQLSTSGSATATDEPRSSGAPSDPAALQSALVPLERVGEAPEDEDRPIELAVLDNQVSVVTRPGQLTVDFQTDYARADRSRAVFRGVELVEAVLVGVFDINESRQDVLTTSLGLRYGATRRLEFGARIPLVHRSDASIVAPVAGSTNDNEAATIDSSVKGTGIGDLELTARYQLIAGRNGRPFVIANLQGVIPTGSDPFAIPRDELGRASRASTGAGFFGISPSFTAILPSDPVVLFGTAGYTFNLGKAVDTAIPPVRISYIDPGDSLAASVGIGISFNQRTTLNLGYAHSWVFGTRTSTQLLEPTPAWPGMRETISRDLQLGRLLLGVTYRATQRASINWSVEIGATEDATDLRTSLRVPIVLLTGR
jgi:hypothetical protein